MFAVVVAQASSFTTSWLIGTGNPTVSTVSTALIGLLIFAIWELFWYCLLGAHSLHCDQIDKFHDSKKSLVASYDEMAQQRNEAVKQATTVRAKPALVKQILDRFSSIAPKVEKSQNPTDREKWTEAVRQFLGIALVQTEVVENVLKISPEEMGAISASLASFAEKLNESQIRHGLLESDVLPFVNWQPS